MWVCMCNGVTSNTIQEIIDDGARSTKEIETRCGAGAVCGRCRHTVRVMLQKAVDSAEPPPDRIKRRWGGR